MRRTSLSIDQAPIPYLLLKNDIYLWLWIQVNTLPSRKWFSFKEPEYEKIDDLNARFKIFKFVLLQR
jgi:hypothetical protein